MNCGYACPGWLAVGCGGGVENILKPRSVLFGLARLTLSLNQNYGTEFEYLTFPILPKSIRKFQVVGKSSKP